MNKIKFHITASSYFLPPDFIFTKWNAFSFFYNGQISIQKSISICLLETK